MIVNCENCGGTHYGSIRCPYTPEQGAAFKGMAKEETFPLQQHVTIAQGWPSALQPIQAIGGEPRKLEYDPSSADWPMIDAPCILGDDKTIETCRSKFSNFPEGFQFTGEPFIPPPSEEEK
jgi:hypothetical protein